MSNFMPRRPAFQPRIAKQGPYTVPAAGAPHVHGETVPRRHPSAQHGLLEQPEPGIATVYDILKRSARKFGTANALGSRKVLDTHVETQTTKDGRGGIADKQWTYYELSDYTYISFLELEQKALRIGAAMRALGLQKNDRIEIYGATSAFWFMVAQGKIALFRSSSALVSTWQALHPSPSPSSPPTTLWVKTVFLTPSNRLMLRPSSSIPLYFLVSLRLSNRPRT
jgi:hypothetical protein